MGQKIHPVGFRLGISSSWNSKWYASGKDVGAKLAIDRQIRSYLAKQLADAIVSKIIIAHLPNYIKVDIYTVKLGLSIGKQGQNIDRIKNHLCRILNTPVKCEINAVGNADIDAAAIAYSVGTRLVKRESCRRVVVRHVAKAYLNKKVLGVKIIVSGRINGAEMANKVVIQEGRIPLHTLSYKIRYCEHHVTTTYGVLGIKVYICFKEFTEGV